MARFDEQPAVTSEAWSFFLRVVAWLVVALVAQDLGNSTDSLALAGLYGLGMGLSLVIIAWNFERGEDEHESSWNGKLGIYLNYLVVAVVVGVWLWVSYQQVADGVTTSATFFWGYVVGLVSVGLASSRGYLKSRSNS